MDNRYASRLVLDVLRYGCACLLPFMATTGLGASLSNFYDQSCHQDSNAALQMCYSKRNTLNSEGDGSVTYSCSSGAGAISLLANGLTAHRFLAPSLGATICEAEFTRENDNADAIVILNSDLGTAETNIQNLQDYTAANDAANTTQNNRLDGHDQSITTLNDQRIAQGDLINANTTRRNQVDQILVTIDGELVDLSDTQALIASDVGSLFNGQSTNANAIGSLGTVVAANQQSFNDYQSVQLANQAQTSADLQVLNTTATTTNSLLQGVITAQQQNENAIAVSHGKFDTQISYLSTLNPKLDTLNNATATLVASQQLTLERAEQTRDGVNTSNARLNEISAALYRDSTGQEHGQEISDRLDVIRDQLVNNQSFISGGMFRDNTGQEHGLEIANRLDTLNSTMSGISFDISGTNINIDNSGVETRLDTLVSSQQLTLERAEQTRDNAGATTTAVNTTIANDAVYANQVNTKLDTLNSNFTNSLPVNTSNVDIGQSQQTTYTSLSNTPIMAAFSSLGTIWTGSTATTTCPTATFDLTGTILGTSVVMDMHCTIIGDIIPILTILLQLAWSLTAVYTFMRA
jgi:hypothetical protein